MKWIIFLWFFIGVAAGKSPMTQMIAKQELIAHGKIAYDRRCSGCHGLKGDGNGIGSYFLDPKPRDFTSGIFKFRSGAIGSLPTDEDLMKVLSKGILGTSMPSFADIPEQERFAIVQYLKTFSSLWNEKSSFSAPIQGAPLPEEDFLDYKKFISRAQKGREIYKDACVTCHGLTGKGDGEGAVDLADDWGQKIRPANFSKLTIKSGKSVRDIYQAILTGMNGTPMTSYKDAYTDDQLWDVTAWILYMRGFYNGTYSEKNPPINLISAEEIQ